MKQTTKNDLKKIAVVLIIAILAITNGAQFLSYHELQTPIIPHFSVKFQMPWRDKKLLSPMASQSARLSFKVYAAEEPQIDPSKVDVFNQDEVRGYIRQETIKMFGPEEWPAMDSLLKGESNYQTYVMNHEGSGAAGIFQALPKEKLGPKGLDLANQVKWGLNYVATRYKSPTKAYAFWNSNSPRWY